MEGRLLLRALSRRRAAVLLAAIAVAIGSSVASALLHVSGDVSRKLTRELRVLGPNLLLVAGGPAAGPEAAPGGGAGAGYLDEGLARARLRAAGLEGAALLLVVARVNGSPVQSVGAGLGTLRRLHPAWGRPP